MIGINIHNGNKILSLALISLYFCISLALVVQAQTVTQPPIIPTGSTTSKDAKNKDIQKLYIPHNADQQSNKTYLQNQLLPGIAATVIGIVGGLSLLFVIISGIQLLTSYGNGDAAGKAKKTLTWAVIGIIVASLSYAIVRIVATINIPK